MKEAVGSNCFEMQAKVLNFIATGVSAEELNVVLQKDKKLKEKLKEVKNVFVRNKERENELKKELAPLRKLRPQVLSVAGGKFGGEKLANEGVFVLKLNTLS